MLAWVALFFGIGLFFTAPIEEYAILAAEHPLWIWGTGTLIYSALRFYTCFVFTKVAEAISMLAAMFGVILWTHFFLSALHAMGHTIHPDDFVVLTFIVAEAWVWASTLSEFNITYDRRKP
jgi:hypothetical protein